MNKEELLQELREILCMYSLPYIEKQYKPIHYACVRYNDLAKKQFQEIDRLNNIINKLEKTISQRIEILNERKKEESIYAEVTSKLDELYFIYGKLKRIKG